MPQNKRESLIYSVLMCFVMVFWMSIYNVSLHHGTVGLAIIQEAWMGFPIAYVFALVCDWFLVSGLAKKVAFRFLVTPESAVWKKGVAISCCMVTPMVVLMSLYGAFEVCVRTGTWGSLLLIWLTNIPKNFVMALPFQLLIAGNLVRTLFRRLFPVGAIS